MADYSVVRNIAVIAINSPPVNALGAAVRNAIQNGLQKANRDHNVKAVLIYGKGQTFPAGADIKEFEGRRAKGQELTDGENKSALPFKDFETSSKPVVAAVHGTCLGGGFELALLAHYRVAHERAVFGFPEVKLGILPGWGGTQRLPRAASLKFALEVIPFGGNLSAKVAEKAGLLHKIVSGNIYEEGLKFTQSIIGQPFQHLIASQKDVPDKANVDVLVQGALARVKRVSPGQIAPIFCIKAVEASVRQPTFAEGLAKEKECAAVLFGSGQAVALQYAFFAERAATKWELPGGLNNKTVKGRPFQTGCVIGAGTMGTGIAMAMLNVGIPVVLIEQNEKFLQHGVSILQSLYEGSVKLGRMSPDQAKKCLSLLKPTIDFQQAKDADIVIEAVFENMDIKKEVFRKLDQICKPGAMLCSNTSSLSIDEIASATSRPQDVIGIHFFVPAYHMRLLENVKGAKTSPETIATATNYGLKIKKVPVLVGNCHGFVGNRMYFKYGAEAGFMIEEGALPQQVDQVLEDFGMPLGPLKVGDLSGLDIGWRIRQGLIGADRLDGTLREVLGERYNSLPDLLCKQGRFGRKTGKGWYRYEKPGAKQPIADDDVTDLILQYCRKNGIQRRKISSQEILERVLYSTINEGFKILEEGIAGKPEDIDVIWLMGYGWPRQSGGPMFYANSVGLDRVLDRIRYYHQQHPTVPHWKPSALLERLSRGKVPMKDWATQAKSKL